MDTIHGTINNNKKFPSLIQQILDLDEDYENTLEYITLRLLNKEITQSQFDKMYEILVIQSDLDEETIQLEHGFDIVTMKPLFLVN